MQLTYLKWLSLISLAVSTAWLIMNPSFEAVLAVLASISGLVSGYIGEKRQSRPPQQRQIVSKSSTGIQAGGDININIGELGGKKDA